MQSDLHMQDFVIDLLKSKLPDYYYYHDYEHTLYVLTKSIEIATAEKCTEYEIRLIKTAALWHDTGFLNKYVGHEEESCLLVKNNLTEFGFDLVEIDLICRMIMATKIQAKTRQSGKPFAAIIIDARANGKAKIVCENLTSSR